MLNDHWGYAKGDNNYKSVSELIENLLDCRRCNCNFLLNVGLMGNGSVKGIDGAILREIGAFIKANKGFIYGVRKADIQAENADILVNGDTYYAVIKDVLMRADANVQRLGKERLITIFTDKKVKNVRWLDSGKRVKVKKNVFVEDPFEYGISRSVRIARFELE